MRAYKRDLELEKPVRWWRGGKPISLGVDTVVAVIKIAWGKKRRLEVQDAQSSMGS
jgi:hypothetical protein